jgi:hypothetical protein
MRRSADSIQEQNVGVGNIRWLNSCRFKDWCRGLANYPDEASELALAHVSSDATRAAYARDELPPMRTRNFERGVPSSQTLRHTRVGMRPVPPPSNGEVLDVQG